MSASSVSARWSSASGSVPTALLRFPSLDLSPPRSSSGRSRTRTIASSAPPPANLSTSPFPNPAPVAPLPYPPEPDEDAAPAAADLSRRRASVLMATVLPQLIFHASRSRASDQESDSNEASIIRGEVRKVITKAKAPGLLRLAFHDGGTFNMKENTGGMNGSIVYELDRPENSGLAKPVKVLDKCKKELDKFLSVSWADLIAIAGSEAVSLCRGPFIPVRIGRISASVPDPPDQLPLESLDAANLKKCFLSKGFNTQELVALSGAHTLGNKGFGNPFVFDNSYYKILLEKPWTFSDAMASMIGLPSDHALVEDDECTSWVKIYAADQEQFFSDFSRAYIKLVDSGVSWR